MIPYLDSFEITMVNEKSEKLNLWVAHVEENNEHTTDEASAFTIRFTIRRVYSPFCSINFVRSRDPITIIQQRSSSMPLRTTVVRSQSFSILFCGNKTSVHHTRDQTRLRAHQGAAIGTGKRRK